MAGISGSSSYNNLMIEYATTGNFFSAGGGFIGTMNQNQYDNGKRVFLSYFNMSFSGVANNDGGTWAIAAGTSTPFGTQNVLQASGAVYLAQLTPAASMYPANFIVDVLEKTGPHDQDIGIGATAFNQLYSGYIIDPNSGLAGNLKMSR